MDDAPKTDDIPMRKPNTDDGPVSSRTRSKTKAKRSINRRSSSEDDIPMRKSARRRSSFVKDKVENKS